MEQYTTKKYCGASSIRGSRRGRDLIAEALIAGSCVVCGKTLERKKYEKGNLENIEKFKNRKTCGKIKDTDGFLIWSSCMKKYHTGDGNPNFKGIMPRCKVCGKNTGYLSTTSGKCKATNYCREHYIEYGKKNLIFKKQGELLNKYKKICKN